MESSFSVQFDPETGETSIIDENESIALCIDDLVSTINLCIALGAMVIRKEEDAGLHPAVVSNVYLDVTHRVDGSTMRIAPRTEKEGQMGS